MSFDIRVAEPDEYEVLRNWTEQEKWNPGIYDYLAFKQIDPQGFFVGTLDGVPVAMLGCAIYDQKFGFVGWYLVKEKYRGKGYGYAVWKKAFERVSTQNLALDGVLAQEKNYEKSGFKTQHYTTRLITDGTNDGYIHEKMKLVKDIPFEDLSKYDQTMFPTNRDRVLKVWISLPESFTVAYIDEGQVKGYSILRKSTEGHRIGPLFADTPEIAEHLFKTMLGKASKQAKVAIDVPDLNKDAQGWKQKYKMSEGLTCARMYTKEFPNIPVEKCIYGFTSLEFG